MGDLRTTAEERRRVTDAAFARGDMDHRACLAVLDDLDTLLAENAKLRAVAEAARAYHETCNPGVDPSAERARRTLGDVLAALEAP